MAPLLDWTAHFEPPRRRPKTTVAYFRVEPMPANRIPCDFCTVTQNSIAKRKCPMCDSNAMELKSPI